MGNQMSQQSEAGVSDLSRLRQGLVGEFLFHGNAEDTSGYGNHGIVEGATLTEDRFGVANRAYAFSGQGDFIVLDPPPALHGDAFSLSVWVKYGREAKLAGWNNAIISQDDNGRHPDKTKRVFQLSTKGEYVTFHLMMRGRDVVGKQTIQRDVWHHLVALYDGNEYKLYINGELQGSQAGSFQPNADEPIFIGKKNSQEPRFWFHGALDDIRIYNRALTEAEVSELYTEHGYTGDPGLVTAPPIETRSIQPPIKKKAVKRPAKKTLERQSFNWNDCYNSFALALYGVMQYSTKRIDLPQALVYTGQAFAINTDTNVMPMDVFGDGSLLREALNNFGYDMDVLTANMHGGVWEPDTVDKALDMVRESIHRGMAVVGYNLHNYEYGLIYGYDDNRRILNIHDIDMREGGELSYDDFGRRMRFNEKIDPEMFVLTLKEREVKPHLSVTRYSEQEDASYRNTLHAALSLAIRHIDDKGSEEHDRKNGIAAIDAWISAFEAGTAHPFFTSYNLLWITSTRQYLVPFFIQSAIPHCMSIRDNELQQMMLRASDIYLSSYRAWIGLRTMFPFPDSASTTDPQLKAEAIRLLREARDAEVAGLEILREIVQHLSESK